MDELKIIGRIYTDFPEKFGIPRQSGLVKGALGTVVFEPEYRRKEAFRGLEGYSHIWILWGFSKAERKNWSATVKPPRLGGKKRMGVFATRSPFRPNPIGMSAVKLEEIVMDKKLGPVLKVSGVDMLDGTPVYDIKPYLPYTDAHPEAEGGFGQAHREDGIRVVFPEALSERLPEDKREAVLHVLQQDPRAAYNKQPDYCYGMEFADYDIRFTVENDTLTVCDVIAAKGQDFERIK